MHPRLSKPFSKLEKIKADILNDVSLLSDQDYFKSINGKWSVAQILTHIMTSEQMALSYMKKKSLGLPRLKKSGIMQPLKLFVLKISQRIPFKYKAPQSIVDNTPAPLAFAEIDLRWTLLRLELQSFLDNITAGNVDKLIFKHPIAGMFNASQGLAFLREHLIHHQPQIYRIIRATKSSSNRKDLRASKT